MKNKSIIYLNRNWCKHCGICVEICKENIFILDKRKQIDIVNSEKCIGCRMCEWHCPEFAISILG